VNWVFAALLFLSPAVLYGIALVAAALVFA
jgi:hypothetical protein